MMKRTLLLLLPFILMNGNYVYGEFKAKNVVIVVGDQFRHDESFGNPTHQYIPHLWKDMVPNASRCVTFYGNPSYMALVHLAIITGSWKDLRRLKQDDIPEQPTMFEYYRKALKKDKNSCYFITSKPELNFLTYSSHEEYGEDFGATAEFTKQPNNDEELFQKLTAFMTKNHPPLVFVILGGAHSFNKKQVPADMVRYRRQLTEMDDHIYRIWGAIQADPVYKDKTDFFFLNDHGDILLQEDCDDECKRYLVIMALGPDIIKNYSTENKWRQINICPTVGKILNFPTPYVAKDAAVIDDFFINGGK
jgi:hypothetical protein